MQNPAMERRVTSPDWFDRTPFAKEIGFIALGLAMGLMIGSGWTNTAKISEVYSNAHSYVQAHVGQSTAEKVSPMPNCIPAHPEAK